MSIKCKDLVALTLDIFDLRVVQTVNQRIKVVCVCESIDGSSVADVTSRVTLSVSGPRFRRSEAFRATSSESDPRSSRTRSGDRVRRGEGGGGLGVCRYVMLMILLIVVSLVRFGVVLDS